MDHLGLAMSEGLSDDRPNGQRPTITRVAALSSILDVFFSGHLNRICDEQFAEWLAEQRALPAEARNVLSEKVDGLFYVMYSGGDDLFIVGPWDQVLKLAQRLHDEFAAFTDHNPNLTLSAGMAQVKPRYPTQKFAELADEAEKASKDAGRNRMTAYGQTVSWDDAPTFNELMSLSKRLQEGVEQRLLPRGLIVDLGQIYRQHLDRKTSGYG